MEDAKKKIEELKAKIKDIDTQSKELYNQKCSLLDALEQTSIDYVVDSKFLNDTRWRLFPGSSYEWECLDQKLGVDFFELHQRFLIDNAVFQCYSDGLVLSISKEKMADFARKHGLILDVSTEVKKLLEKVAELKKMAK